MDSLKSFFKRRSWPSTKTLSKSHLHRDSKTPGVSFVNEGLGVGAVSYHHENHADETVLSSPDVLPSTPSHSSKTYCGYQVCIMTDEQRKKSLVEIPRNVAPIKTPAQFAATRDQSYVSSHGWSADEDIVDFNKLSCPVTPSGEQPEQPKSLLYLQPEQPKSLPSSAVLRKIPIKAELGTGMLSLNCATVLTQEEANPCSASREITPVASTRNSYNLKKYPDSPGGDFQVVGPEDLGVDRMVLSPRPAKGDETTISRLHQSPEYWGINGLSQARYSLAASSAEPVPTDEASAGVFGTTPRAVPFNGSSISFDQSHRSLREGPLQTRDIPPLDQTPLWTHRSASVTSSTSSRSAVPTPRSSIPTPRSSGLVSSSCIANGAAAPLASQHLPAQTSNFTRRQNPAQNIPSWEIPAIDGYDGIPGHARAYPSVNTRESQNPGIKD